MLVLVIVELILIALLGVFFLHTRNQLIELRSHYDQLRLAKAADEGGIKDLEKHARELGHDQNRLLLQKEQLQLAKTDREKRISELETRIHEQEAQIRQLEERLK